MTTRWWHAGLLAVALIYLHNAVPYLTMMPRVNVDEPWLMERGYELMRTGIPSQPMLRLDHAYLLQVGYGYLLAGWMWLFGVGLLQVRLLAALLGLGTVVMVAVIGRRTIDPVTGVAAALFLALDSNFLGGARSGRTDIPSVFFVVAALAAYVRGRRRAEVRWFVCAGACLGLAMLCHGNAFWAGVIMIGWLCFDYGQRVVFAPFAYAVLGGWLLTFGPYLAVVLVRWADVQVQIGNFAADRVPGLRPAFVVEQVVREAERYRGWYFGLVTSSVPNPLLWTFRAAIVAGVAALVWRSWRPRVTADAAADPAGPLRLLILSAGAAVIFAGFVNNKVPVYLPHLMIGFSLAAGFAVSEVVSLVPWERRSALAVIFLVAYGAAGVAYYEKWYSTVRKGELVPYEQTDATLRALVPGGSKYVFASPQFWTTFHDDPGTTFYSYTAGQPSSDASSTIVPGVADDRPIVLVVDEYQWLSELTGVSSSSAEWQRSWIAFIEQRCVLDGVALGTAHGTLAAYRCARGAAPAGGPPRLIGGAAEYRIGDLVMDQGAADLAQWPRYEDPRRTPSQQPDVRLTADGVRVSGTGWPGIVRTLPVAPGESYVVTATTHGTRDGDLLYLGTWQQPQVLSLSGASSSGIPGPLVAPRWFPHERAFRATATAVRVLVYSEAPETDFMVSSLQIRRLGPMTEARGR